MIPSGAINIVNIYTADSCETIPCPVKKDEFLATIFSHIDIRKSNKITIIAKYPDIFYIVTNITVPPYIILI